MSLLLFLLLLHLVCCLILLILVIIGILRCFKEDVVLSFLIPIFGPVTALIRSWFYRRQEKLEAREHGVEKLTVDDEIKKSIQFEENDDTDSVVPISEALIINNPATRRSLVKNIMYDVAGTLDQEAANSSAVVPLSDALLVNDPRERRQLFMDALYTDPGLYVSQLTEAKENEDSEVVHYAVTALVEIQKDYENRFQLIKQELLENPEDPVVLRRYQNLLEEYLGSGMLEGDNRRQQLLSYREVLKKRMETESFLSLRVKMAGVDEELEDAAALMEDAEVLLRMDPDSEAGYLSRVTACVMRRDHRGIEETISLLRKKKIHLSSTGKQKIQFWERTSGA